MTMIDLMTVPSSLRYCSHHPYVRLALTALLFTCIALSIVLLGWWMPAHREYTRLWAEIDASRKQTIEALRTEQLLQASRNASQALTLIEKKLQHNAGQADLVQSLTQLAARYHVQVLSQSFDEGKPVDRYLALRVDLALQGSYPALRNYIGDLALLNEWVAVEETRLERVKGGPGLIKASLHLITYRQTPSRKAE